MKIILYFEKMFENKKHSIKSYQKYACHFFLFVTLFSWSQSSVEKNLHIRDSLLTIYNTCQDIEKAKAAYSLSMSYKSIGEEKDTALVYAEKAKEFSLQFKDYELYAKSLKRIGVLFLYSDEYEKAKNYLERALRIAEDDKDLALTASIKNGLGLFYQRQASYKKSLMYLTDAYYYFSTQEASKLKHSAYEYLGVLYFKLKEYEKSKELLENAINIAVEINDVERKLSSLTNIAIIHAETGEYAEAIKIYKKSLKINQQEGNTYRYKDWTANNNLALIYLMQKKYDSSLYYCEKTLKIPTDNFFDSKICRTYNTLGNTYMQLNDYAKAEMYILKSLKIATKNKIKDVIMYCNEDLYKLYKAQENYKKALFFYEKHKALEREILDKNFSKEITKIESSKVIEQKDVAYASLSKEKEEDKKEFESDLERIIWLTSLTLIGIISVVVFFVYRNKANLAEKQKQISMAKLFALRSQMNPHFIFNTINGVQNFILKSDKFHAYNYLSKFSQSIRLILDNSNNSFIRLQKEIDLIKVYVELEKIRFRNKLDFKFTIDQEVEEHNPYIPAMILQPLIENAIIHGISNKPEGGLVTLSIQKYGENLKVAVEDNGIGRKEAQKIKMSKSKIFTSITSINTKQRIEILNKSGYKDANCFFEDISATDTKVKGTRSIVILPLKNRHDKNS